MRVNPYYGWGFDTDVASGKSGLFQLTDKMVQERMIALLRVTGELSAWGQWNKDTVRNVLRQYFVGDYAHKKRAKWDPQTHAFYVKTKKAGVEVRIEL